MCDDSDKIIHFLKKKRKRKTVYSKSIKMKKGLKQLKKVFQPAFGCAQHPNAGQNTQQISETIQITD